MAHKTTETTKEHTIHNEYNANTITTSTNIITTTMK
jgi:hypothetical protein